mmetsp:Transcript_2590/g.5674  ORF Transcript_2590/g.5674 Transcript_2590/m.5674 type:complete len:216 (-) Transcript_2590:1914-2561(-)
MPRAYMCAPHVHASAGWVGPALRGHNVGARMLQDACGPRGALPLPPPRPRRGRGDHLPRGHPPGSGVRRGRLGRPVLFGALPAAQAACHGGAGLVQGRNDDSERRLRRPDPHRHPASGPDPVFDAPLARLPPSKRSPTVLFARALGRRQRRRRARFARGLGRRGPAVRVPDAGAARGRVRAAVAADPPRHPPEPGKRHLPRAGDPGGRRGERRVV